MIVEVGLNLWALKGSPAAVDLHAALTDTYKGRPFVEVASPPEAAGVKTLDAEMLKNTNKMKLYVFSNEKTKQVRLTAVLDNLGKGASGAAVQSLNIMAGLSETAGLV
ncbi:MAG: hypothetical protein ISQ86_05940 [Alphaproteobacteria bacterium]|nr:hypothetical protein [Alphaproteobacteria bacterium]